MQPSELLTFGDRLRSLRLAKDMSQAELARRIGRHQTAVGPYERDEYMPGRDVVEKIAGVLETSPEYLIFGRSPHRTELAVIGRVGAGTLIDERRTGLDKTMLSLSGERMVLLEITDGSMAPRFPIGHILLAAAATDDEVETHMGEPVLALLEDNRSMLRILLPGRERGKYDLAALDSPTLPSMAVRSVRKVLGALDPQAFVSSDQDSVQSYYG